MVLLGNTNTGLNVERCRLVLMKINLKLEDLVEREPSKYPKGLRIGEDMIKTLSKYVMTFTVLDKVQFNMRKIFRAGVFGQAIRKSPRGPISQITDTQELPAEVTRLPFIPKEDMPIVEEAINHVDKAQLDIRVSTISTFSSSLGRVEGLLTHFP
ncbi:hypothetical protein NDU88_001661 [Pleurodeles waltl]|uniref:Uncharacterized protein n=1 Tax=Pleurodeles waltl TaxID=8319 RepID=A0AAV7U713_PLEWA|nr:hypothetical protein NDU88_001661 [Pleurodeles waltl]